MNTAKNLRIVYMGTSEFSSKILEFLIQEGANVVGVVSQPDKPVGRKNILMNTPVKEVALANNIKVYLLNFCKFHLMLQKEH